ncbi:MAG: GFA family protein, partial [Pseudomonadota bacterium]
TRHGSCLCGSVRYETRGTLREAVACHCTQCRKQSGHFFVATDTYDSDFTLHDSNGSLKWYAASDDAKRGFCGTCGSAMFWKANGSSTISILLGSMDSPTGLSLDRHIFVADKGDHYAIPSAALQFDADDSHDPRPSHQRFDTE